MCDHYRYIAHVTLKIKTNWNSVYVAPFVPVWYDSHFNVPWLEWLILFGNLTVSFVISPLHSFLPNFQLPESDLHSYVWKRRRGVYVWGGSSENVFFFKELLYYTTPCLRNSFPLSTIILEAVRFFFPTQAEIRKLEHTGGTLHKIVLKTGAG